MPTHRFPPLIAIAWIGLVLLFGTAPGHAQDLGYSSGSNGSDGAFSVLEPFHAGLQGMATAYDPIRQRLIIFGGAQEDRNDAVALGRMWTWDGVQFEEVSPAMLPPARHSAVMVWDSVRNQIVLFGGRDGQTLFDDTWVWDGTNWTEREPAARPPARWNHAGAFDAARGQLVIFGGGIGSPVVGDTWVWDGTNWTQREPASTPSLRFQHSMAYDAARGRTLLFGGRAGSGILAETWTWDGTTWREEALPSQPPATVGGALVYDPSTSEVLLIGGSAQHRGDRVHDHLWAWNGTQWDERVIPFRPSARYFHGTAYIPGQGVVIVGGESFDVNLNDIWRLNESSWTQVTGSEFFFDMRGRDSGVWQFTSITIPASVTIQFAPNAANTPVVWLASESVVIDGGIRLDGEDGQVNDGESQGTQPGPGGFRGGIGGGPEPETGTFAGQPGLGPGGGAPGVARVANGSHGQYAGMYGNLLVDPLMGGSGGGGGAAADGNRLGSDGGAGGGAILIASSRDLTLNGAITARGGDSSTTNGDGGHGSGGAVVLVADRLLGSGTIDVTSRLGGEGRVRLEGFERPLAAGSITTPIVGPPYTQRTFENLPELMITSVAGIPLNEPTQGNFRTPDVSLSSTDTVVVQITARNVPDGAPVQLIVGSPEGRVTFPAEGDPDVTLANGSAEFRVVLPAGAGTLQATTAF